MEKSIFIILIPHLMKILLINTHNELGGAAIACKRLHLALLQEGHDCKLLVVNSKTKQPKIVSFLENVTFSGKLLMIIKHFFFKFRFYRQYKNKPKGHYLHSPPHSVFDIKKHELYDWADIINLHWVSGFIDFPTFFSKKSAKPIVWTLHDMNPFTGGCHHAENCEGFKISCKRCPQLTSEYENYSYQNWGVKHQANLTNLHIVSPSSWLNKQSLSSSLFCNQNHFIIPNAVDTNIFKIYDKAFCRSFFNIPKNQKTILFVAQDVNIPLKGMHYLVDIIDTFEDTVSILVVGQNKLTWSSKNIISLGTINDERIMALLYNTADIFVLPSLAENLPNVIIESLCCGTPVVAFDVGGIPDLIEHGENGFIAEKDNKASLFRYLNKALSYNWKKERICEKARKQYNLHLQTNKYISLFKNILLNNTKLK